MRREERKGRTAAIGCVVLIVHGALVVTIMRSIRNARTPDANEVALTLVTFEPPRPILQTPVAAPPPKLARRQPRSPIDTSPSTAITESPAPAPPPKVDWQREADRGAADFADEAFAEDKTRHFDERDLGAPITHGGAQKPKHPFEWKPERKKAGFMGPIPYIRLGKRCVVALLGFGCAIGPLPKANGDLFLHMHDDDESSEPPRAPPSKAAE